MSTPRPTSRLSTAPPSRRPSWTIRGLPAEAGSGAVERHRSLRRLWAADGAHNPVGARAYRCRRHHQQGECPEPCHVGEWIDGYVADAVRGLMKGRGYKASQVNRRLDRTQRELEAAENARDDFAAATAGMAREDIAAGMQAHAQAVKLARRAFAEARAAAVPVPDMRSFGEAWDSLSAEKRRHVLRAALGAVVVRKGTGIDPGRVRILEPGAVVAEDEPVDFDRLEGVVVVP